MNELAKHDSHLPALPTQTSEVLSSDVLIPRLLLMQGLSDLVSARKAGLGDMVRSTTAEKLGDPDKPIDILPLKMVNTWVNFEVIGKQTYHSTEARTAANEMLPWEYVSNGVDCVRKKAITLFALLPADIDAFSKGDEGELPDLSRTLLPIVMTFQGTSFKTAAKPVATFFNNIKIHSARHKSIQPYFYTLPLGCKDEKNDLGNYFVFTVGQPKGVLPAKKDLYAQEAAIWLTNLNSKDIKVDDSAVDDGLVEDENSMV